MSTGRTVAWIDERDADDGNLTIHFTNGTALSVWGSSCEEVSLDCEALDYAEVQQRFRRRQGEREAGRLERLRDEEWLAVSCETRAQRNAAKEARVQEERDWRFIPPVWLEDSLYASIGATRIQHRCERCGDRRCPNAKVVQVEPPRGIQHVAGSIRISKQLLDQGT